MRRRACLGTLGSVAAGLSASFPLGGPDKLHVVNRSFDDGFRRSFIRTAEIYEKYGFSACFNIIASAHFPATRCVTTI